MAATDNDTAYLKENQLEDGNCKCTDDFSASFVYSTTRKTLNEKRKQKDLEVQREYDAFTQKMKMQQFLLDALEDVVPICHNVGKHSTEELDLVDVPLSPLQSCESIAVHKIPTNVKLNKRMKNLEKYRNVHQQQEMGATVSDNAGDDAGLDLDSINSSLLEEEVNRKFTVKINHNGTDLRYDMHMNDSFSALKLWLAGKAGIKTSEVSIVFGCRTLQTDDTPASIGLAAADILDFIPVSVLQSVPTGQTDSNLIRLILRTKNLREKFPFSVHNDTKMSILLNEFAKKFNRDVTKLELHFDGETLDLASTAAELDLEDDFQIDVIERD